MLVAGLCLRVSSPVMVSFTPECFACNRIPVLHTSSLIARKTAVTYLQIGLLHEAVRSSGALYFLRAEHSAWHTVSAYYVSVK